MTGAPLKHFVEDWYTVAVTALPDGWRNVYLDAKTGTLIVTACPALLLQELRSTARTQQIPGPPGQWRLDRHVEHHESPFDTRVAYAEDDETGGLGAAVDLADDYQRTIAAGVEPHLAVGVHAADNRDAGTAPDRVDRCGLCDAPANSQGEVCDACSDVAGRDGAA